MSGLVEGLTAQVREAAAAVQDLRRAQQQADVAAQAAALDLRAQAAAAFHARVDGFRSHASAAAVAATWRARGEECEALQQPLRQQVDDNERAPLEEAIARFNSLLAELEVHWPTRGSLLSSAQLHAFPPWDAF